MEERDLVKCGEEKLGGEQGFTLIELLTSMVLVGILSAMSIQSFQIYRQSAAYGVAEATLRHTRTAVEAAIVQPDIVLPDVDYQQTEPGSVSDVDANQLLPGLVVPKNVRLMVYHDSECFDSSCPSTSIQVDPCYGTKYLTWVRMGDGEEILTEDLPGASCE